MAIRELAPKEWPAFFEAFTGSHRTWLVDLAVLGFDVGAQEEVRELPLKAIAVGPEPPGKTSLTIEFGDAWGTPIAHVMRGVSHVRIKDSAEGAEEAIEIESKNGDISLLRLRESPRPELVDDVVSELRT